MLSIWYCTDNCNLAKYPYWGLKPYGSKHNNILAEYFNIFLRFLCFSHRNRTILNGKLLIDLKKPSRELYKQAERAVGIYDKNVLNSLWWCVLDKARTHFERFEDGDF